MCTRERGPRDENTDANQFHFARNGAFRGSEKPGFNSPRAVVHLGYPDYTIALLDLEFFNFSFLLFDRFWKQNKALCDSKGGTSTWNNHFYHNISAGMSPWSSPVLAHAWVTPLRQGGPLAHSCPPSSYTAPHCQIQLLKSLSASYHSCVKWCVFSCLLIHVQVF